MLTPKQEKFCQCIVSGMDGKTSYLHAYSGNSEKTAEIESVKLMKRDDITERITELNKPVINLVQNSAISARKKQIEFIEERIAICKEKEDENSIIRYTDMLNKLYSLYKEEVSSEKQDNPLENIDNNTLSKLISAG